MLLFLLRLYTGHKVPVAAPAFWPWGYADMHYQGRLLATSLHYAE